MNLPGSRVLLTGGGRGIGRHLCERLAESGASVFVLESDQALCEELGNLPGFALRARQCNVADAESVDSAVAAVIESGFCPDVLINNAGVIHSEPLVNLLARTERVHSLENWRRVMATDLDSVFLVTRRVVDHMLRSRRKGIVISISSIAAAGNAGQTAYSAAKAAVNALTYAWAKELGPLGMRFAAIAPGFLDTPSTRAALSDSVIGRLQQQIPLRRLGDMEAVFLAVRYVMENDYVSGTVIEVDGGMVL